MIVEEPVQRRHFLDCEVLYGIRHLPRKHSHSLSPLTNPCRSGRVYHGRGTYPGHGRNPSPATVFPVSYLFRTKMLDKPVYNLLQALRVAHGDASQWEILQAALVAFGGLSKEQREAALVLTRQAPSDQPEVYPIAP